MTGEVKWNTAQLQAFAKSLQSDRDGRKLRAEMNAQFDSITEDLRDRLREEVANLPGPGSYPSVLAEALTFRTKIIGGKNARVSVVGEAKTSKGKWREVGTLLDQGYLYHPAWGHWRSIPLPGYLRQQVPTATNVPRNALSKGEPYIRDEIRSVLTEYLDRLADIRKAQA